MPNYKIKKGDTLSAIAKKEGTTVSKLMQLNPQITNKNMIMSGSMLNLPYDTKKAQTDLQQKTKEAGMKKVEAARKGMEATLKKSTAVSKAKKVEKIKSNKESGLSLGSAAIGVGSAVVGRGLIKKAARAVKSSSVSKGAVKAGKMVSPVIKATGGRGRIASAVIKGLGGMMKAKKK
jgi:hypothetical protein